MTHKKYQSHTILGEQLNYLYDADRWPAQNLKTARLTHRAERFKPLSVIPQPTGHGEHLNNKTHPFSFFPSPGIEKMKNDVGAAQVFDAHCVGGQLEGSLCGDPS